MKFPQACTEKFSLYLYQNGYLDESCIIKKTEAKMIYDKFKKEFQIKLKFYIVIRRSNDFVKHIEKGTFLQYDKKKLEQLLKNLVEIDSAFFAITPVENKIKNPKFQQMRENTCLFDNGCKLCGISFNNKEDLAKHINDKQHLFYQNYFKAIKVSKFQLNPIITIKNCSSLRNIIIRKDTPVTFQLEIKTLAQKALTILDVETNPKIEGIQLKALCPCNISSSSVITWELDVKCSNEGVLFYPILIKFQKNNELLYHPIELVFHTHDEFFDELHPIEPFQPKSKISKNEEVENPDINSKISQRDVVPLKKYRLTDDTLKVLNSNLKPFDGMSINQRNELDYITDLVKAEESETSLTVRHNYIKLLKILLFMEEHQMLRNMKSYDRSDQKITRAGNLVELQVPDLAEHRPSIMVSDTVRLKDCSDNKILYDGIVREVRENSVLLKFPNRALSSLFSGNKRFHVSFILSRYTLQVQHQALEFANSDNISHFFFPKNIPKSSQNEPQLEFFNKEIYNNPEQQQAIRAILNKSAMPAPYLIFGPPGTGKTMTVVECIKQILAKTNEKILVCTPSNSAANELMKRLIDTLTPKDLFRFVALSFAHQMPPELIKFSNFRRSVYFQPTVEDFIKHRVIVTTLISASKLVNRGCPKNHFTYVFIDEAGQATECETLIPIARILSNPDRQGQILGQIVLAGDPKQLGPVIQSPLAKKFGFGTSMLERLMETCPQYKRDSNGKYNPAALTKLVKNYRSHPVIVNQPDLLFYENELEICGDSLINAATNWEGLPSENFPMIFHSVIGEDQREKGSPSFFNVQEIQTVLQYLDKLIGCQMQGKTITQDDILIISPYRKQVEKIRQACSKKRYFDLLIGSVEQIQGREKLIVIISTVRSKVQLLQFDAKFHLGFLNNPKRFNVAITRAKALLIVVGNPNILQFDKYWKSLIEYCKNNEAIIGDHFELLDTENESLAATQNMSSQNETDSGAGSFSGAST